MILVRSKTSPAMENTSKRQSYLLAYLILKPMLPWGIRLWGVEFHGSLLHNCFHFFLYLQIFLAPSHFSPFASRAFLTSSIHVFLGLLLFDFPSSFASCTFPAKLSSRILVTCPSHLNCPHCIVTSIDSAFNSPLYISFLILSNLVLFYILLRNLVSVLFFHLCSIILMNVPILILQLFWPDLPLLPVGFPFCLGTRHPLK